MDSAEELTDETGLLRVVEPTTEPDGRLVYDLSSWPSESRKALDAVLLSVGVERVWQGPEVVVRSMDGPDTDEAIAELVADGSPGLDHGRTRVIYEIGEWPLRLQLNLFDALAVTQVVYERLSDGSISIYEDDEETVDDIFEALPEPADVGVEWDGEQLNSQLSRLFGALDALSKNPDHSAAGSDLLAVTDEMEWVAVPFGFTAQEWNALVVESCDLAAAVDNGLHGELDDSDDGDADADDDDDADAGDDAVNGAADDAASTSTGASKPVDDTDSAAAALQASGRAQIERRHFVARAADLRERLRALV